MNINIIRNSISKEQNIVHLFIYKGIRGQNEKFLGRIVKIYPRIFIIETNEGVIKSFSYSDFIIKNLKMY